jgi:hypothetical protein
MVEPPSSPTPPVWSTEARTWASLALFIHLAAVFVAVTTFTRPSELQDELHQLFAPYLRNLHLTPYPVTYPFARYHLTLGSDSDAEFTCEVDFDQNDAGAQTVAIPTRGVQPGIRYRRYQAMSNAAGAMAVDEQSEDLSGILPGAIAGGVLRQHGATSGVVRVRGHFPPDLERMTEAAASGNNPLENYRVVYEAQVFVNPTGVEVLKKSQKLETAPSEKSKRSDAERP